MTFVEHIYPAIAWGKNITVKLDSDELEVSALVPVLQEDWDASPDALRAYRQAVSRYGGAKRQGKNSPHIEFANADTDQKLIRFVQRFGPVIVRSVYAEERDISTDDPFHFRTTQTVLVARQDLAELRTERAAYRSALALVSELQRGKRSDSAIIRECVLEIVESVSEWPQQWLRERQLRAGGQGYGAEPTWLFRQNNVRHLKTWEYDATRERSGDRLKELLSGPDPIRAGHNVVCELVNAFSPHVYPWGTNPVEAPDWDLTCSGIRPVLYYILRREYLQASGIGICRNTECRDVFEIERSGQEFCGDACSRLQRQREYWQRAGKMLRKRRTRIRKSGRRPPTRSGISKQEKAKIPDS
jgi:hypothetical protein